MLVNQRGERLRARSVDGSAFVEFVKLSARDRLLS
jgi:hypothetical protein